MSSSLVSVWVFVCACRSRWSPCMSHEALSGHVCKLPSFFLCRLLLHASLQMYAMPSNTYFAGHVAHTATLAICRFWNRLVAMPDTRLTKQAFLENCALATRPARTSRSSACWAAQVCSFLHFMSPIVDGKPQRIDTSAVSAHLQRRMYDDI